MARKEKSDPQYITERPSFEELAQLRDEALDIVDAIRSLAEENDIIQRATDLFEITKHFKNSVRKLVIED